MKVSQQPDLAWRAMVGHLISEIPWYRQQEVMEAAREAAEHALRESPRRAHPQAQHQTQQ